MTGLSGFWYIRLVSARSSFFRLIRSLRPSASRLAAVILVCICSEVMSFDILKASPRGLELGLAHSPLLRRIGLLLLLLSNQGGVGVKWTNEAITAALQALIVRARRTSREGRNTQVSKACEREKWLCGDVVEAMNNRRQL